MNSDYLDPRARMALERSVARCTVFCWGFLDKAARTLDSALQGPGMTLKKISTSIYQRSPWVAKKSVYIPTTLSSGVESRHATYRASEDRGSLLAEQSVTGAKKASATAMLEPPSEHRSPARSSRGSSAPPAQKLPNDWKHWPEIERGWRRNPNYGKSSSGATQVHEPRMSELAYALSKEPKLLTYSDLSDLVVLSGKSVTLYSVDRQGVLHQEFIV